MQDLPVVHSSSYKFRRFLNWFPLGLSYALLYMGRYNLTVSKTALGGLMSKATFGEIFGVGAWVYALAFLINGPLTDRIGGKKSMLVGLTGTCIANTLMGMHLSTVMHSPNPDPAAIKTSFMFLYAMNMYFQSFGAVSIVKINAPWFHIRERGIFSAIFGIMISTGLFLAFDINERILHATAGMGINGGEAVWWVFYGPAVLLALFAVFELLMLKDRPSDAGFANFDTGDASSGEDDKPIGVFEVLKRIMTNPIILTIAFVEFCTGVLRNSVMQWFKIFAGEKIKAGATGGWTFTNDNWGLLLMVAGIIGGMIAGIISDKLFQSRRAPAAGFLYAATLICVIVMIFGLNNSWVMAALTFCISVCVIGTHGLLSGTATMDFGGRKAAATAVGIIDGFVYLGTGLQALAIGYITTSPSLGWKYWPVFMVPFAIIGILLLIKIWNAKPTPIGQKEEPLQEPLD